MATECQTTDPYCIQYDIESGGDGDGRGEVRNSLYFLNWCLSDKGVPYSMNGIQARNMFYCLLYHISNSACIGVESPILGTFLSMHTQLFISLEVVSP